MPVREMDALWVKQASGVYVPFHEITGWSAASVGDYLAKGAGDTLKMVAAVTGGGATTGTGSPEGVVTAAVGAFYVQTDASTASDGVWYKQTGAGNTGWVQVTASDGTGGATILYDSTALAAPASSIDTGAAGIASGSDVLEIWAYLRADQAVANAAVDMRFNGDSTSGNYFSQRVSGAHTTASAGVNNIGSGVVITCPGASSTAGVFGCCRVSVPFYAETTAHKAMELTFGNPDTTDTNKTAHVYLARWDQATAISQVSFHAPAGQNFIAGSHVIIYGR